MLQSYCSKEGDGRNRQDPDMQESDGSREGTCERNVRLGRERNQPAEGRDESAGMWSVGMEQEVWNVHPWWLWRQELSLCAGWHVPKSFPAPSHLCVLRGGEPWGGLLALWFWGNYPKYWRKCIFNLLPSPPNWSPSQGRQQSSFYFPPFFFSCTDDIDTVYSINFMSTSAQRKANCDNY